MPPAHFIADLLAYSVGFHLYRYGRTKSLMSGRQAAWVLVSTIAGALVGSRLVLLVAGTEGKSIVGGLLGATIGVEIAKRVLGVKERTGDDVVFPLIAGLAIGRIGCFLSGIHDLTHGLPTTLPWGVDMGDGVMRHPVHLYEVAFLAVLAALLAWRARRPHRRGDLFRGLIVGYAAFRYLVDFLKPYPKPWVFGITSIQLVCLFAVIGYGPGALRLLLPERRPEGDPLTGRALIAWQLGIVLVAVASWGCVGWLASMSLNEGIRSRGFLQVNVDRRDPAKTTFKIVGTRIYGYETGDVVPGGFEIEIDGKKLRRNGDVFEGRVPARAEHVATFRPGWLEAYDLKLPKPPVIDDPTLGQGMVKNPWKARPKTEPDEVHATWISFFQKEPGDGLFSYTLGILKDGVSPGNVGSGRPAQPGTNRVLLQSKDPMTGPFCIVAVPYVTYEKARQQGDTHFGMQIRSSYVLWCK